MSKTEAATRGFAAKISISRRVGPPFPSISSIPNFYPRPGASAKFLMIWWKFSLIPFARGSGGTGGGWTKKFTQIVHISV